MTAASSAIRTIGLRCGDTSGAAVQEMAARLQPDRSAYRAQASQSLAGIGPSARTEVAALNSQLGQGAPEDRQRVVQGLSDAARFSSAAVATLVKEGSAPGEGWDVAIGGGPLTTAIGDEQGPVRQAAAQGIRAASKEATSAATALQSAPRYDPAVRRAASQALEDIDQYASAAVPVLLGALKDTDPQVQRAAAQAIGELGPSARDSAPALVDAVKSESTGVRAEAALALGRIGAEPATTVPTLAEALDHPDPAVRYQAARALGLLGSDAAPAVPKLQAAMGQPDAAMRYQAARALTAIDPSAVNGRADEIGRMDAAEIGPLLAAVKGEDPQSRREAGEVLGNLGPAAVATLPELAGGLAGAPTATRQHLAMTMQAITSSALDEVPDLIRAMQDGGPEADRAARILGELGGNANRAKLDLIEALDDPDPGIRLMVAELLGDISDYNAQVIGALVAQALEQDQEAYAALVETAAGG
jgi:HEAT repeat protein